MAASDIPKDRTVDALRSVWGSLDSLLDTLDGDQWKLPTPLPGWNVQANVVHVFGTEAFLLGQQPDRTIDPAALEHVHNPIGEMNENWVASYAERDPAEVLDRFRTLTAERLKVLDAMPREEWDTVGFTPAGEDTYGRFMQIRVFDCWMHEQDIRAAVRAPGHDSGPAVEVTLDEMQTAMGFVVGKKAGAPDGASVTFDLTGASGRPIHVMVDGRARLVPELPGPATATLTMPLISFTRLAGGRLDAPDHRSAVTISGDRDLGERVLDQLRYTI